MKFLVAVMVSTVIATPTFAACSKDKLAECTKQADCVALSVAGGQEFEFVSNKCIVKELKSTSTLAADCISKDDSKREAMGQKGAGGAGGPGKDGKDAGK